MYDIRLLTLFKQHYRDGYDTSLKGHYSCWGYFDGLDISPIPSDTPLDGLFSALWSRNGKKIAMQKGDYSSQNISLLRYLPDEKTQRMTGGFWEDNLPFFAVMLVQLEDESNFARVGAMAEEIGNSQYQEQKQGESGHSTVCRTLSYYTFDNSDLVLLVRSNSLHHLQRTIHEMEAWPEIRYVHSVLAVSESYLDLHKKGKTSKDGDAFLDEIIPEIQISAVTDGDAANKGRMRAQLEKWTQERCIAPLLEHATVSDKHGHETYTISLRDVSVGDMLWLFVPGAFGTHQNPLCGKSVYNISTSLLFNRRQLPDVPTEELPAPDKELPAPAEKLLAPDEELPDVFAEELSDTESKFWCKKLIKKYQGHLRKAYKKKNESLCSYYQAMIQTLNTLSQYEQFELSENIFLILIQPFLMFSEQFSDTLDMQEDEQMWTQVDSSLCQFLDYANMVIYHTIHTDQTFLMVPGYSGTSFSIPVKLTLLFLWLSRKLTSVLNDSNHVYQCILTPVMESKPMTQLIEFDPSDQNRLIAIKVSQRLLYHPKALTVILSHEIAHYVGKDMRCRKFRLKCLGKLLTYYVTERLLPSETYLDLPVTVTEAYKAYYRLLLDSLWAHLKEHVSAFQEEEPYAGQCAEQLARECRRWLVRQSDSSRSLVLHIPESLERKLLLDRTSYTELMRSLAEVQKSVEEHWRELLASKICEDVIEEAVSASREIFSDMAAFATLECDTDSFMEAFSASEGVIIDESNCPAEQWFRQDIANRVVRGGRGLPKCYHLKKGNVKEEFYQYEGTLKHLYAYAEKCYGEIKKHLHTSPDVQKLHQELRDFYRLFSARSEEGKNFYTEISAYILAYKREVKDWLKRQG